VAVIVLLVVVAALSMVDVTMEALVVVVDGVDVVSLAPVVPLVGWVVAEVPVALGVLSEVGVVADLIVIEVRVFFTWVLEVLEILLFGVLGVLGVFVGLGVLVEVLALGVLVGVLGVLVLLAEVGLMDVGGIFVDWLSFFCIGDEVWE
jgi:hypothetical protein